MYYYWLIFLFTILIIGFLLLYPFYLKENKPERLKGIWVKLEYFCGNRYGAIWIIYIFLGLSIFNITSIYVNELVLKLIIVLIYFILIGFIFLWYPYYLRYKKNNRYNGIWKFIGDWMGDPFEVFRRKK